MSDALTLPELPPHEARDLRLRQGAGRLFTDFLDWAETARESIREKDHERFGFVSEREYFNERIGLAYRSVARYIQVLDGLDAVGAEQIEARKAFLQIGVAKAGIIAPAIMRGHDWKGLVAFAVDASPEALQEKVSTLTGLGRRKAGDPQEDWIVKFLGLLPEDARFRVEWALRTVMRLMAAPKPAGALLMMVDMAIRDLADQGETMPEGKGKGP